jgi:PadR family transcriptional regulator PadR
MQSDNSELLDDIEPENDEENKSSSSISSDLIRGHINTIILRTLYERDKYGYEIIEEIEKKSHGQYTLKQPTLYSALKRLESQGYITAYWKTDEVTLGGRRKYYKLTDSGKEITEKNLSEWEYSRTVIDNLISDKSFDFSQPAPTPVDFNILKKSTSRVPLVKVENEEEKPEQTENKGVNEVVTYETVSDQTVFIDLPPESVVKKPEEKLENVEKDEQKSEQREILHKNYLKLISEPIEKKPIKNEPTDEELVENSKLLYNNKPETERDYANLINNLYVKTLSNRTNTKVEERPAPSPIPQSKVNEVSYIRVDDVRQKADGDGLKVNSSEYTIPTTRKTSYNMGGALLKSSLVVAIVMLLEFALCLIFNGQLKISLAYPFVIFALAAAQLIIFGAIYYMDRGRYTRKPKSSVYISVCTVVTVITVVIIFLVSILLGINFQQVSEILSKLVIPSVVALNIPTFAVCFYMFSK